MSVKTNYRYKVDVNDMSFHIISKTNQVQPRAAWPFWLRPLSFWREGYAVAQDFYVKDQANSVFRGIGYLFNSLNKLIDPLSNHQPDVEIFEVSEVTARYCHRKIGYKFAKGTLVSLGLIKTKTVVKDWSCKSYQHEFSQDKIEYIKPTPSTQNYTSKHGYGGFFGIPKVLPHVEHFDPSSAQENKYRNLDPTNKFSRERAAPGIHTDKSGTYQKTPHGDILDLG